VIVTIERHATWAKCFDAFGSLVGTNQVLGFDAEIVRDGNGREGKRSQKLWDVDEEEWGEVKSTYQIFSSVLGRTVSEADTTGKKWRTFVIAAGAEIARQAVLENDDEAVTLVHTDPSGVSTFSMSIGTGFAHDTQAMKTEELDGLGNNVGTFGSMSRPPYSGGVMDSPADAITMDDITYGDCALDGIITSCSLVNRLAGSGALQLEVRYYGSNGFSYQYYDFDNSLPGRHSMSIFIPDWINERTEANVVDDDAPLPPPLSPFVPSGTWFRLSLGWRNDDPVPPKKHHFLGKKRIEKVRSALSKVLERDYCMDFMRDFLTELGTLTGVKPYSTDVLAIYDELWKQLKIRGTVEAVKNTRDKGKDRSDALGRRSSRRRIRNSHCRFKRDTLRIGNPDPTSRNRSRRRKQGCQGKQYALRS
jgi:hypothetical protein